MSCPHITTARQASDPESLQIVPDSPLVVFHGTPSQAHDTELKGSVHLSCSETLSIKRIKLYLEGIRKIHISPDIISATEVSQYGIFYHKEVDLPLTKEKSKKRLQKVHGGTYKWPFKFTLEKDLPETVDGLEDNYIAYRLVAVVQKCYLAKNIRKVHNIRVIRTLSQDTLDTIPLEQISQEIWSNKISYQIMIPQVDHLFGTSISASFELTPLLKGLRLGKIKMELHESVTLRASSGTSESYQSKESFSRISEKVRVIAKRETETPEMSEQLFSESEAEDLQQDECIKFALSTPLPKSLKQARQSADNKWIRVKHTMKIVVNIKNPDGHISQIIWKSPIRLFFSPEYPIAGDLTVSTGDSANHGPINMRSNPAPPPRYGDHRQDQMIDSLTSLSRRDSNESNSSLLESNSDSSDMSTPFRASLLIDSSDESGSSNISNNTSAESVLSIYDQHQSSSLPPHLKMVQQLFDRLNCLPQLSTFSFQSSSSIEQHPSTSRTPSDDLSDPAAPGQALPSYSRHPMINNNITFAITQPHDRRYSLQLESHPIQPTNTIYNIGRSHSATMIPTNDVFIESSDKPPTYEVATSRAPSPVTSPAPRRIVAAGKSFIRRSLLLEIHNTC